MIKIFFHDTYAEDDPQINAMRAAGFKLVKYLEEADLVYTAPVMNMKSGVKLKNVSGKPLVAYCWDYYLWSHEKKNMSGDWKEYAQNLKHADVIMVPSSGQQLRLKELLGLDSHVVLSGIRRFPHEPKKGDYILDPLRYYPEENQFWAEEAAKELGIPIIHSEHGYSREDFQKLVAECRFLICAVREASTGSLTISEGLWLGKPSLISDSPYMGGKDYLGDYATYFKHDDFEDLKKKMKSMWDNTPEIDIAEARKYMDEKLTYKKMGEDMYEICKKFISQHHVK